MPTEPPRTAARRRACFGLCGLVGGFLGFAVAFALSTAMTSRVHEAMDRGKPWYEGVPEYGWWLFSWWWVLPVGGALLGLVVAAVCGARTRSTVA